MLKIQIRGLKNGVYPVAISTPVEKIENMFPEFRGDVEVTGELQKLGNKYLFNGVAECSAILICDRSTTEYTERVRSEISLVFIANTEMYLVRDEESEPGTPVYIREDDSEIDITEEVRQELAVSLPMKRIAPAYRDYEISDLYPSLGQEDEEKPVDERWAKLKNISFPTNNTSNEE